MGTFYKGSRPEEMIRTTGLRDPEKMSFAHTLTKTKRGGFLTTHGGGSNSADNELFQARLSLKRAIDHMPSGRVKYP